MMKILSFPAKHINLRISINRDFYQQSVEQLERAIRCYFDKLFRQAYNSASTAVSHTLKRRYS